MGFVGWTSKMSSERGWLARAVSAGFIFVGREGSAAEGRMRRTVRSAGLFPRLEAIKLFSSVDILRKGDDASGNRD